MDETKRILMSTPIPIRISKKAKRMQLVASPKRGVELVVPSRKRISERAIRRFTEQKREWIEKQQKRLLIKLNKRREDAIMKHMSRIPFEGGTYELLLQKRRSGKTQIILNRESRTIRLLFCVGSEPGLRTELEQWYREQARAALIRDVNMCAEEQEVTFGKISIRSQKTLWGSCSGSGNLSFNWRLILLPVHVRQYIVHHELSHRVWRGHGKRFWARVQKFDPDMTVHRAILRKDGQKLMAFLREDVQIYTQD